MSIRGLVYAVVMIITCVTLGDGLSRIGGYSTGGGTSRTAVPEGNVACSKCEGKRLVACISCKGANKGRTCIRCNGMGVVKCSACNGKGYVKAPRSQTVKKPILGQKTQGNVVLREKLAVEKDYLRAFFRERGIVCSNKVQLVQYQRQLLNKCLGEDKDLKKALSDNGYSFEFDEENVVMLTAPGANIGNLQAVTLLVPFRDASKALLQQWKKMMGDRKKEIDGEVERFPYYKTLCDVHKWDDECCPKFGADYLSEDMKAKYFANRMKAYEMEKQKIIQCSCDKGKSKYLAAQKRKEAALNELSVNSAKVKNVLLAWEDMRQGEMIQLKDLEKAGESFDKIYELVQQLR